MSQVLLPKIQAIVQDAGPTLRDITYQKRVAGEWFGLLVENV